MVKAKLIIDGKEINLLWFSFTFEKGADGTGRPSQKAVFKRLKLTIEARKDLDLAEWSFSSYETKQLEIHIYPVIMGGKTRKLYFYDCHLLAWENDFIATGTQPMSETLEISCGGVEDSTSVGVYSAYWRTTIPRDEAEATVINNSEDKIIDCYLTDLENNEKPNLEIEKEVYLVIKTENLIGQTKDIDISNFGKAFAYNDEILQDNILRNFSISSDLQKVKLKIIKMQSKKSALEN